MSAPVDVLNMLRKFEHTYMATGLQEEAADIALIFAVVAELIGVATRMDSRGFFDDIPYSPDPDLVAMKAALANVGGAK